MGWEFLSVLQIYSKMIPGFEDNFEDVLRDLIFDPREDTRNGASWIIAHDEFLGEIHHEELKYWGAGSRSVMNIIGNGEQAGRILLVHFLERLDTDKKRHWVD